MAKLTENIPQRKAQHERSLAELEADRKARDAETFSWEEAKRAAVEVRSRCVK